MVLSADQKTELLNRLKAGKEKKKLEKEKLEKENLEKQKLENVEKQKVEKKEDPGKLTFKEIKTANQENVILKDAIFESDEDNEISEDNEPLTKDFTKKVKVEDALSNLPKVDKLEKKKKEKEKPYLKIKLYKEPSNPGMINKLVDSINEDLKDDKPKRIQKSEPIPIPQISERQKKLQELCKIYFN